MTATLTPEKAPRTKTSDAGWTNICPFEMLTPDRGVCALVAGKQVAVFRVAPDDRIYAVSNRDPFSETNVVSRGIVGCRGGVPKVSSPMHGQSFSLATGECLDCASVKLATYPVRLRAGTVQVRVPH